MKRKHSLDSFLIKNLHHKLFVALALLLLSLWLQAQTIAEPEILNFNTIGQKEGLLQQNVKCMALDDLGYLWLGTEDGLLRFNGYEFKAFLFNPNDSNSIQDDHIRGMQFSNGKLWLASNSKGICYYDPPENRFHNLLNDNQNPELNTGYNVLQPEKDTLLFSLKNNLILVNLETDSALELRLPGSKKECIVNDALKLDGDNYWLATSSAGILEFDVKKSEYLRTNILNNASNNCFLRNKNLVFIGAKEGLFIYDLDTKQLRPTSFTNSVNCFNRIDAQSFFIGTSQGLFLYNLPANTIRPQIIKTPDNFFHRQLDINQILTDSKGNLWIGTEGDGLFHFNSYQKKFNSIEVRLNDFPFVSNISTFQLLPGKDSTLWLGTKYGMVKYSYKTRVFKFYDSKDRPLIYTIKKDDNNNIWVGGFTSGLLRYDEEKDRFTKVNLSLPDDDVIEIIPINKNTLLICTWAGGIHQFHIESGKTTEYLIDGKRVNRARTSLIDSNGSLWLGTDQGAFCVSSSGTVRTYRAGDNRKTTLSGERIFDISEDNNGNIWFGTNVGLTKLDTRTQQTTVYYKQKGFPNDFIYSVLIAPNNDVWVSTNYGISVLRQATGAFTNFTSSDGLQNNEFNGKAGFQDEFGNFYFGGISGVNIFHPENIVENPHMPNVYIESVDLFNSPIKRNVLFEKELSFKSKENVLTFNFTALNYIELEKCSYSYKMEGFDSDWRPTTKNRNTTYTNLDPGTYFFHVKATNEAGIWSTFTDTMKITIIPPWYATIIFRILFAIAFLLSGLIFYILKTNRLKTEKIKLEGIVAHRTRQVQEKNTELQKAFDVAASQRDNVRFLMKELRHRVNNNLQIISSLLNIQAKTTSNTEAINILEMAKNRILAIANVESKIRNDSEKLILSDFILEISESIIKALSIEKHLKYTPIYELEEFEIQNINTTLIGLVLNELITNVHKYAFNENSPENILRIVCRLEQDKCVLIVADNGKGYQKNNIRSNSMGLKLVSGMINQLNGEITVVNSNGTTNRIIIPL